METKAAGVVLAMPEKAAGGGLRGAGAALWRWMRVFWRRLRARGRRRRKSLAVVESTALGERRFVSVVEFEGQRFLIGSSPSAVTLLARLRDAGAAGRDAGSEGGER